MDLGTDADKRVLCMPIHVQHIGSIHIHICDVLDNLPDIMLPLGTDADK